MTEDVQTLLYFLRDPDFNPGDEVKPDPVTETVETIELRKTRFRNVDGDVVGVANRDVEKKWTQVGTTAEAESSARVADAVENPQGSPASLIP